MDWLDLLAVQGTLKSLQHHTSKASILLRSAFFIAQLSHPYMTTGKTTALTIWTFIGKVMSLVFNMLSRLVITFLPRSQRLLISWLQSPSAVILEPPKNKVCQIDLQSSWKASKITLLKILLWKAREKWTTQEIRGTTCFSPLSVLMWKLTFSWFSELPFRWRDR